MAWEELLSTTRALRSFQLTTPCGIPNTPFYLTRSSSSSCEHLLHNQTGRPTSTTSHLLGMETTPMLDITFQPTGYDASRFTKSPRRNKLIYVKIGILPTAARQRYDPSSFVNRG